MVVPPLPFSDAKPAAEQAAAVAAAQAAAKLRKGGGGGRAGAGGGGGMPGPLGYSEEDDSEGAGGLGYTAVFANMAVAANRKPRKWASGASSATGSVAGDDLERDYSERALPVYGIHSGQRSAPVSDVPQQQQAAGLYMHGMPGASPGPGSGAFSGGYAAGGGAGGEPPLAPPPGRVVMGSRRRLAGGGREGVQQLLKQHQEMPEGLFNPS
ncbi:hypothetical protein CLOM_g15742 [Closterium sp. NIES-68]|nr:hypothetical protein CLOM_g15742 [Closterium sp. NIES-68]